MRGKGDDCHEQFVVCGITPAYAGKRKKINKLNALYKDHPCICGEKLMKNEYYSLKKRITPAYAGKRYTWKNRTIICQDHPCICGEKIIGKAFSILIAGSPLHMRKSNAPFAFDIETRDHPCICGEKI